MENGVCPYNHKCKFAHGSHELRRNEEVNFRYKTKECGTFFKEGSCHYGDRCNFLHVKKNRDFKHERRQQMWVNFGLMIGGLPEESRLLAIL